MKNLKLIFILALVNIINVNNLFSQKYYAHEYSKLIKEEMSFQNPQAENLFVIQNINGTIKLEGYDGNTVQVTIQKTIKSHEKSTLELGKNEIQVGIFQKPKEIYFYLDTPETTFDEQGGSFSCISNNKGYGRSKYSYELNYQVLVPKNTNIKLKNVSGRLSYASNLNCSNVEVSNVSGHSKIENIQATQITVGSVSGHVEANRLTAKKIHAKTVSGHVELEEIIGQTKAHSVSGNIYISYVKNPIKASSFTTTSGNVNLYFQSNLKANVEYAIRMSGKLYSDFNTSSSQKTNTRSNNSYQKGQCTGSASSNNIKSPFKIGQGGPDFYFETGSGNIYLNKASNQ